MYEYIYIYTYMYMCTQTLKSTLGSLGSWGLRASLFPRNSRLRAPRRYFGRSVDQSVDQSASTIRSVDVCSKAMKRMEPSCNHCFSLCTYIHIYTSADPLGPSGRAEVLCSPFGETRFRETLGTGGPTPTHTFPHLGPPRATRATYVG